MAPEVSRQSGSVGSDPWPSLTRRGRRPDQGGTACPLSRHSGSSEQSQQLDGTWGPLQLGDQSWRFLILVQCSSVDRQWTSSERGVTGVRVHARA